jgi:hypothetical protein
MTDVTVYGGKYRYIFDKDGARALRYGEPWRDCCGDGFILALAQDLEEAREQRDALAEALRALRDDGAWIGGVPSEGAQAMADAALQQLENDQ